MTDESVDHEWAGREDGHNCQTCIETGDNFHKCDRLAHSAATLQRIQLEARDKTAAENLRRFGGIAGAGFHP